MSGVTEGSDSPIDRAEEAVCKAVEAKAAAASPEEVGKLAHAVAEMKHGPQGGSYNYSGSYDEHRTSHQGEDRERPPAGF
jgi:hypothetical protein